MARSDRTPFRRPVGWPAIEAGVAVHLQRDPPSRIAWLLPVLVAVLYAAGLGYPLVVADFAFLGAQQLEAYRRALPAVGGTWLADASFGWWAWLAGVQWSWHRALQLALHAASAVLAFALFRRILESCAVAATGANGWIAFAAAALFALHPAAVYTVAYLSARYALLASFFALLALWSTARSLREGARGGWALTAAATAAALASSAAAIGIPFALAFLVSMLPAAEERRRRAWIGVGLSAAVVAAYALVWASVPFAGGAPYLDAVAGSSARLLQYLALWLLPLTALMAIDMPQAAPRIAAVSGWLALAGVFALVGLIGWLLARRAPPLVRAAAIGLGIATALYTAELLWPRLASEYALSRSYIFMPCVALVPACIVAALPLRASWIAALLTLALWLVLAAQSLQTFSSHSALWDDAVRRIERLGAKAEDARVYLNRATVHRREGHPLAALADYDRALALQPDMTRALRGRAQVYLDEKRYGDALRDLDRVLALEPEEPMVHADRGIALMQSGRLQDAGRAFDRALEQGAKEPRVYLNRALARLQLGGVTAAQAALADIEQALSLDPNYALAHYNRAVVFELAAKARVRLRDAVSPELLRAVALQNLNRACELGYQRACERMRAQEAEVPAGAQEGAIRVTPEWLRSQGVPVTR